MKKISLIFCLVFNINLYSFTYSAPTPITDAQLKTYMQNCFAGHAYTDMDSYQSNITVQTAENGQVFLIQYAEVVINCETESYYLNHPAQSSTNTLYALEIRRGVSDLCIGSDYVIGWEGVYTCEPSVGKFILLPHSIYYSGDYPECEETLSDGKWNVYEANPQVNLNLTKYQSNTYTHTDSYYWNSYSCTHATDDGLGSNTGTTSGTTSSGSSGSPGTSTTVSGTSSNTAVLNELDSIASDLENIKTSNSDTKDIIVDKIDDSNNTLNLTREDIANLKTDISTKLVDLNSQLETIKAADISQNTKLDSITTQNTNITTQLQTINTQNSDIQTSISDLSLDTTDQINGLSSALEGKIASDIDTYGAIMDKLDSLDNQLSGLSSSQGSSSGSTTGTTGDLSGIGAGLTNIDNTLKGNLSDENGKPFLKSINDYLTNSSKPISGDDLSNSQSSINTAISSSLSDSFSKYSNILGLGSSYGGVPSDITVDLMGHNYTILDFSVIDDYVDIIRSLFLSLAYLYGFMNLIRGNK